MRIIALLAGTLCFFSNGKLTNCRATKDAVMQLAPAAEARRVVWTGDDGKRLAVATLPPKADAIDLGKLRDVTLRVTGDAARGWPAELRIAFDKDVIYTVPAKAVSKLTTISLPPGRYTLAFRAEHYTTTQRSFDLTSQPRVDAGEIRLRPLPLLTGRIVTAREGKDVPVPGADVSFQGNLPRWITSAHLATSDENGAFRAELPENVRNAVIVSAERLVSTSLPMARNEGADVDLGTIHLAHGVPLTVRVMRPPSLREKALTISVVRRDRGVYEPTLVATAQLKPADDSVTFDVVGPGENCVVAAGSHPFERVSVPVKIEEGKPAGVELRIEPYTLAGRATFGGEPLAGASVDVRAADGSWNVNAEVAADGTFGGAAWPHGVLDGEVRDTPERAGVTYAVRSPELGADPTVWNINIKKRVITGRVYDAETKQPLPNIELMIDATLQKMRMHSNMRLGEDGHFSYAAVQPGLYEFSVASSDYLPKRVAVQIAEEDDSKQADLALERTTPQALALRWSDGAPVANAAVYDGNPPGPLMLPPVYRSDATGIVRVPGKSGEVHTLYVLPEEGSIAIVRLPIGGKEAAEAIVGRPVGALRVVTVDPDGKPAGAALVLRFNGELIPVEMLMQRFGRNIFGVNAERVFDRLPAGSYEVSVPTPPGIPPQPVTRVGISSGEERVQIVVPKR